MAAFSSNGSPNLGSLNLPGFLPVPPLPTILAEWSALIPLAYHLASFRHDHQLTGQVALLGQLSISIFPKLGVLKGIARLLEDGSEFLDQASSRGSSSRTVWDVQWGSVFPCANGAVSSMITKYAMARAKPLVKLPETLLRFLPARSVTANSDVTSRTKFSKSSTLVAMRTNSSGRGECLELEKTVSASTVAPSSPPQAFLPFNELSTPKMGSSSPRVANTAPRAYIIPRKPVPPRKAPKPPFRRPQTLNVLHFTRNSSPRTHSNRQTAKLPPLVIALTFIFQVSITAVLLLLGIYGTALVVLTGSLTTLITRRLRISRPQGFLSSNEEHNACMLVSIHQNASTWYLYVGDRGVVDSILNKTMLLLPQQRPKFLIVWLKMAHILQMLATTFVAGQKGWDGVALVSLVLATSVFSLRYTDDKLAEGWLRSNGVGVSATSFEFTGRMPMVGAIQAFSGSRCTGWMDEIVAPHARRQVWLRRVMAGSGGDEVEMIEDEVLSESDRKWVELSAGLALEAAGIMKMNVYEGGDAESV